MISEELISSMDQILPLRDVVFNTLRQAILTGEMKPGERLLEIHLANQLGVSRTPIREAIKKLELEGLVIMIPRRGAEVAKITAQSLQEVLEVRRCLDVLCIEFACQRISEEEIQMLKEAEERFLKATQGHNWKEIAQADVEFHNIIINATRNKKLIGLVHNLAEQMYRYRFEYIKDLSIHPILIEEHNKIVEAVTNRDEKIASEVAVAHIDNQMKAIARQLQLEHKLTK